jgi:hypothetical protein
MTTLQEKIEAAVDGGMDTFGIRVMTSNPIQNVVISTNQGDEISPSFEWVDGEVTGIELGGTSALWFDVDYCDGEVNTDSFNKAMDKISQYMYDECTVVVCGGSLDIDAICNDIGEVVIRSAKIIQVIN